MIILYKMPQQGWHADQTIEPEEMAEFAASLKHNLTVATLQEWDYLKGMELMLGQATPLEFDPTGFRKSGVTQLKVMGL